MADSNDQQALNPTESADTVAPDSREAELEAALAEMQDRMMRALAEAENTRKRAQRDKREAEAYGASRLARDLLPVYDALNRALASATDETRQLAGPFVEGIELTLRELSTVMERHGLERIAPNPGDPFDPQHHQAMFEAPVPNVARGCIIQVMAEGFLLHDRLLRPAQVGVSSRPNG
jgi:molecular chaperone GrpE